MKHFFQLCKRAVLVAALATLGMPGAAPANDRPANPVEYADASSEAYVLGELKVLFPRALVLEMEGLRLAGPGRFAVLGSAPPERRIFLRRIAHWLEPLSLQAKEDATARDALFTQVQGKAQAADRDGVWHVLAPVLGRRNALQSPVRLRTWQDGAAQLLIGGRQRMDFGANVRAEISWHADVGQTLVEARLDEGLALIEVEGGMGQRQRLEVTTPLGKVACEEGRFAIWTSPEQLTLFVQSGEVFLINADGKPAGSLASAEPGTLPCATVPALKQVDRARTLRRFLEMLAQLNPRARQLEIAQERGKPVDPQDVAWLEQLPKVDWAMPLDRVEADVP